jgi:hypothetical protein
LTFGRERVQKQIKEYRRKKADKNERNPNEILQYLQAAGMVDWKIKLKVMALSGQKKSVIPKF